MNLESDRVHFSNNDRFNYFIIIRSDIPAPNHRVRAPCCRHQGRDRIENTLPLHLLLLTAVVGHHALVCG